ncbi:MAG TPA: hypothetical protein VMT20_04315 [Terriglobia bacterium]|nr:hypothetical protein [Terriglobia bacterium]
MRYLLRTLPIPIRVAAAALFSSVLVTLVLGAPQDSPFDLNGTIHDASKGKFTVDSGQGIFFHVVYDDKTAIVRADGTAGSAQDLKVGATVHLAGDLSETGEVKAARIEIAGETKKEPARSLAQESAFESDVGAEVRTNLECHSESVR